MSNGKDIQAELARLEAQRSELRNEYTEAIRRQDAERGRSEGTQAAPGARTLDQIDADLVKVEQQIGDATRDLAQQIALEPKTPAITEVALELGEKGLGAVKDTVLDGALGGAPTAQAISGAIEHLELQVATRGMIVDGLAEAHVNTKETEKQNLVQEEVRLVDLDAGFKKAIDTMDARHAEKKDQLEGKIALLQEKFDERHADKGPDEKQALQARLEKEFDQLRAQMEKAQELERQRAIEAQARIQAEKYR